MATITLTEQQEEEVYLHVPNVRPGDLEVSPSREWRDWRLRQQRPELRQTPAPTFPDISSSLNALNLTQQQQDERYAARRHHIFTDRSLDDLEGFTATRLQFRPLAETWARLNTLHAKTRPRKPVRGEDQDRLPGFWFEEMASSLFARLWDFAADTFGHADFTHDLHQGDWTERMLRHLPADFIRCASVVARGDPYRQPKTGPRGYNDHGYEFLFLSQNERVYLCTAVLSKLLHEQCIDSLLFGAKPEEMMALEAVDRTNEELADGMKPTCTSRCSPMFCTC